MARLRLNIDDTQTSLPIDDTTALPTNGGVLLIGTEEILYTYASDKEVTGCTRGYNSTSAASHLEGDAVELQSEVTPVVTPTELRDSGSPTDNLTGVGVAEAGARYINSDNGDTYINSGSPSEPTWSLLSTSDVGGVWGAITGDLTDQTDLQTALNSKLETVVAADVDSEAATSGQVLTADGAGAATWQDAGGSGSVGNEGYIQYSDGAGGFAADENFNFQPAEGKLVLLSDTGYNFEFEPQTGAITGVQSLTGPIDDDIVVNATTGFNLNLSVDNAANAINFKFAGDSHFTMGDSGVLGMNVDGAILDFQDGTGPSGELAYISADVTGGMLVVSKSKMLVEAEAGDILLNATGTIDANAEIGVFTTSGSANLSLNNNTQGAIFFNNEDQSNTNSRIISTSSNLTVQSDAGELVLQSPASDVTFAAGSHGMHLQNNGTLSITPNVAPILQFKYDDTSTIVANNAAGSGLQQLNLEATLLNVLAPEIDLTAPATQTATFFQMYDPVAGTIASIKGLYDGTNKYWDFTGILNLARFDFTQGSVTFGGLSNSVAIEPSSALTIGGTVQGFLPPRLTTTERDAIATPAAGLMIYNTTTNKLNVYTTAWEQVTSA